MKAPEDRAAQLRRLARLVDESFTAEDMETYTAAVKEIRDLLKMKERRDALGKARSERMQARFARRQD